MMLRPWLQFFRIPNLPTAPGDALAGAVMGVALTGGDVRHALVAGAAALFLYMYGLADNDIVGADDNGSLFLILTQTTRKAISIVGERLDNKGLKYKIVSGN